VSIDEDLEQEQTLLEKVIEFKRKQLELNSRFISLEKDNMPHLEQDSDSAIEDDTESDQSDDQVEINDFRPPVGKFN
jgi:hypothetical protein